MKKIKYYYNTNTLRYEKLETPLRVKLLRVFGFIAAALVTAGLISYVAFQFIGSPRERILAQQNKSLRDNYRDLEDTLGSLQRQLQDLEKRDNDVYRAIFEANPIPVKWAMARMGLMGGALRLPMTPLAPAHEAVVEQALRAAGLLA